jgi:hypothetical protein
METIVAVYGSSFTFVTDNESTTLRLTSVATPSSDTSPEIINLPSLWLITRGNGTPLFALSPTDGDKTFRVMTAEALYSERIQWFEPLADNYREVIWINPASEIPSSPAGAAFKHLVWKDIIEFSIVERMSISFISRFPGDWKVSSEGGDSYLMVLLEGAVYWADAVGQIPFAVNTFRKYFQEKGAKDAAIVKTVQVGIEYGDGNPLMPISDPTNEYDNFMVLRGAVWASENFSLDVTRNDVEGLVPRSIERVSSRYLAMSDARLRHSCDTASISEYGIWRK